VSVRKHATAPGRLSKVQGWSGLNATVQMPWGGRPFTKLAVFPESQTERQSFPRDPVMAGGRPNSVFVVFGGYGREIPAEIGRPRLQMGASFAADQPGSDDRPGIRVWNGVTTPTYGSGAKRTPGMRPSRYFRGGTEVHGDSLASSR